MTGTNHFHPALAVVLISSFLIATGCGAGQNELRITKATEAAVTFPLGRFACTVIKDGEMPISAVDFFSGIDASKIRAVFKDSGFDPEDVPLSLQIMLVNTGRDLILIDTGLGEPVGADEGRLIEYLGELGIAPEDIDGVIITHGHWDHIGCLADMDGRLHFPKARHWISSKAWEFWTSEENLSQMSEQLARWARENLPPLEGQIELVEAGSEVFPGFTTIAAPGHTPGQMAVLVHSGSQNLLCLADAAHNHVQMEHPEIGYSGDMDPERARLTRRALLERAVKEGMLVYGCHFPFPGLGYVEEENGKRFWRGLKAE